jgi:hypothetical protein
MDYSRDSAWNEALDSEVKKALDEAQAAGKKLYTIYVLGEDEEGAPTHWYPGAWGDSENAFGPVRPLVGGLCDTAVWERENPGYIEVLSLMEEIQDRLTEEWAERHASD